MAVTYLFSPNTRIASAQMNANFDDVESGKALNDGMSFSPVLNNAIALQAKDSGGNKQDLFQLTGNDDTQINVVSGKVLNITDGTNIFTIDPSKAVWRSYIPIWTGAVTNPVIGNGTLAGRYVQIGKLVFFRIYVKMGSTTTYGGGAWSFSLPVTAVSGPVYTFPVKIYDSSGPGAIYVSVGQTSTTTTFNIYQDGDTGIGINPTNPFTWATDDDIALSGMFEAA